MKSFATLCLIALICSAFAYKEASATKLLEIVTSGKINELTELCDRINDNKYRVKDIVAAVPVFENLLTDVINELLVVLPLLKDVVPFTAKPFIEKSERLTYKAINLFKQNLKVIEQNAQRIIDASKDLTHLQIRPDQIRSFFAITSEILAKINVPQC